MALTLRLNDEQEAAITQIQRAHDCSKQQAIVHAISEEAKRTSTRDEARAHARRFVTEYGDVLDRLAAT